MDLLNPKKLEDFRIILANFLRDHPRVNKLIKGCEFEPGDLDLFIIMALDDFNSTPPPLGVRGLENFPSYYLLLMGAAIQALTSSAFAKLRNQLAYSDSGLSIDEDAQGPAYIQMRAMLSQEYETKKLNIKRAINVNRCYGGTPSEYSLIYPYTNRNVR